MKLAISSEHPDPNSLAAYVDSKDLLTADQKVKIERHLSECNQCREIVAETSLFLQNPRILPS